jgi:recombination protein RecA
MANAQKDLTDTRKVALIDMEHSIEPNYLLALGVDTEELILSQPPHGEAALEIADQLIKSGKVKVVVVDSIAALVPKAELDGETGEQRPGLQARMMGQGCRKLSPGVEHNNVLLIFTNQIREKIGVMYGNPETLPAGNAMKFYASMRIDIRKSVTAAEKEKEVNKTTVKIVKSKVSKPFGQCVTEIEWGKGFSRIAEILDIAEEYKVFEKSGSHYSYNGAKLANGREAMLQLLKDNVEMADEIEQKVLTLIKGE